MKGRAICSLETWSFADPLLAHVLPRHSSTTYNKPTYAQLYQRDSAAYSLHHSNGIYARETRFLESNDAMSNGNKQSDRGKT